MMRRVSLPAEAQEVVVLPDDLVAGPGEVQRERRHVAAEVVDVEDELLGQVLLRPARRRTRCPGR